jgi:hypothetical protein
MVGLKVFGFWKRTALDLGEKLNKTEAQLREYIKIIKHNDTLVAALKYDLAKARAGKINPDTKVWCPPDTVKALQKIEKLIEKKDGLYYPLLSLEILDIIRELGDLEQLMIPEGSS